MQNTLPSVSSLPCAIVSSLPSAIRYANPTGWYRLDELPLRKTLARQLCKSGVLQSVLAGTPGSRRGVRLVSKESFDAYLLALPVSLPRCGGLDGGGPNLGRKKKKISVSKIKGL